MNFTIPLGRRISGKFLKFRVILRSVCCGNGKVYFGNNGYEEKLHFDSTLEWKPVVEGALLGISSQVSDDDEENDFRHSFSPRWRYFEDIRFNVERVIEILQQDGPDFDSKLALNKL
ncbi:hypothetical protein FRX31_007461, partial [Thalictrum thalictroides]